MTKEPKPIIINNLQSGITASPFVGGFSDIRNVDISTRPGSARLNFNLQSALPSTASATFTANTGTDIITTSASLEYNGHGAGFQAVTVASTGTLPSPLAAATTYYVVEQTPTSYKLATSLLNANAGTTIDITTAGTGTHTLTVIKMGIVKYEVYDPFNNVYFIQDSNGRVWTNAYGGSSFDIWHLVSGNTLTAANGNGLINFNNYLLAFRDGAIDVYGNLTTITIGDPTKWTNSWKAIFDGGGVFDHVPFYAPINGLVYWAEYKVTNGATNVPSGTSGLGSLIQVDLKVFDPSDSTTFTFTSGVNAGLFSLQLPTYHKITSIILFGATLELGTNQNLVYPWDTISATFALPIIMPESNITGMTNIGNLLFVACGMRGNIYVYNGYTTQKLVQIPLYISGIPQNSIIISSLTKHNGKLYFCVGCKGCSGVWSVVPETGILNFEHEVSLGTYGTNNALIMGGLFSLSSDLLLVGWEDLDSTTFGLDANLVQGKYYQTGYTAYFETQVFNVGVPNAPRTFGNYDVMMAAVLQLGQGLKIYSRGDVLTPYSATPDATFDFTTYGALDSYKLPFGKSYVDVQFKIVLTCSNPSITTPQFNAIQVN